jgi:GST-like protein
MYSAGKFLPSDPRKESLVQQWLAWQISGLGPMLGQLGHFTRFAPVDVPYAKERYLKESRRFLQVLEKVLEGKQYIIGDEYTIADMAIFPWLNAIASQGRLDEIFGGTAPNIKRYIETVSSRPAVQRGLKVTPFS